MNDDGSLKFLGISADSVDKQFTCRSVTQQQLVNTSFYIVDYAENVKTRHGDDRVVVKIKRNLNDPDTCCAKFFTNSRKIKYVLGKIRELDAFPRQVTLRAIGFQYYFE